MKGHEIHERLLRRCLDVVAFAVYEHGGGYTSDGQPKGDPGGWDGITVLMDDLEAFLKAADGEVTG